MSSISVNPSGYSSANSSYNTINSSYPISNSYTNSSSTSYTSITCKTGSNASSYISYLFDLSEIPSGSTIDSVECKVKGRISSTNYISTAVVLLYNNTTAKGSSTSFRSTSTSTTYTLTCGTWTYAELQNLQLRFTATRGTNQTTRGAYMYIYGADLTINYTVSSVKYTITTSSSGPGTISPSGSSSVNQGTSFSLSINPNDNVDVTITDNNVDVTDNLTIVGNGTELSANISAYSTNGNINGTYYKSASGNGSDTSISTTGNDYCTNSGLTAYISYTFDLSSLPSNATITNVTCSVKGHCESTSSSTEVADLLLYSGTTAKGTKTSFTSTSNSIVTVQGGSDWTLSEINDLSLRFTIGYYGGAVCGATVVIEYSVPNTSGNSYNYTISDVEGDHNIVVTFGLIGNYYTVTTSITNGTLISPTESITIAENSPLTISFKGNDGYKFKSMKIDGVSVTPTLIENEMTATWTVTTNYSTYLTYALTNAYDGDQSTYWWSDEAQASGKYILITFSREITLNSFSTYSSHSTDYPHDSNVLQVSTNGDNWQTVGTFQNANTSTFTNLNATNVKYVRIYGESSIESWMVLNEITMGYTVASEVSYTYTIPNITSTTNIVILFGNNSECFLFISNNWYEATSIYKKVAGSWIEITKDDIDRLTHYKKSW